jgi:hypothetical protein
MQASDELAKKKARLAELRKAKEARLASASPGSAQVRIYMIVAFTEQNLFPELTLNSQAPLPSVEELLASIPATLPQSKQTQPSGENIGSSNSQQLEDKNEAAASSDSSARSARKPLSFADAVIFEIPGRSLEVSSLC